MNIYARFGGTLDDDALKDSAMDYVRKSRTTRLVKVFEKMANEDRRSTSFVCQAPETSALLYLHIHVGLIVQIIFTLSNLI